MKKINLKKEDKIIKNNKLKNKISFIEEIIYAYSFCIMFGVILLIYEFIKYLIFN